MDASSRMVFPLENESAKFVVVDSSLLIDPKLSSKNDDGVIFASRFHIETSELTLISSIVPERYRCSPEEVGEIVSTAVIINSSDSEWISANDDSLLLTLSDVNRDGGIGVCINILVS